MRRLVLLAGTLPAASASEPPPPRQPWAGISIEVGWRTDRFAWDSHDEGSQNPPFRSSWSGLEAMTVGIAVREAPERRFAYRLAVDRGWIARGDNHQSGYSADTGAELYSSDNDAGGGWMLNGSADVGIRFRPTERWTVTPLIGIQGHARHLLQRDGVQTTPADGPYDGLDSTFDARWYGPRAALEADYRWDNGVRIRLVGGAAALRYTAEAEWNLRSDLEHPDSYDQHGRGLGWRAETAVELPLSPRLSCSLRLAWEGLHVRSGSDRVHVAEGPDLTADPLHVDQQSWTLALGAGMNL